MRLGIISTYPKKGAKHANAGGVASYTKNLVESLSSQGLKVDVFANAIKEKESYTENNVKVFRCWKRGTFFFLNVFNCIFRERKRLDLLHLQHEFFLYGSVFSAAMFPFLLFLLKILRKPCVVTIHGVVPLSSLNSEFIKANGLKGNPLALRIGFRIIIGFIGIFSKKIIVHEDYLKKVLIEEYGLSKHKVVIIHHGVEDLKSKISQDEAKGLLNFKNKKIILFFGYLSGYKGLDIFVKSFEYLKNKEDYVLIVAGGNHPRLKTDKKYLNEIRSLKELASKNSKNIKFTGFVPEEEIQTYFVAADLIVFPYKYLMAASGPMSFAIAYSKPFIIPKEFESLIKNDKQLFNLSPQGLASKIDSLFKNEQELNSIKQKVNQLKIQRLWGIISNQHKEVYTKIQ